MGLSNEGSGSFGFLESVFTWSFCRAPNAVPLAAQNWAAFHGIFTRCPGYWGIMVMKKFVEELQRILGLITVRVCFGSGEKGGEALGRELT